ncbi:MAG TPA: putative peptidoglycan glycosyltransferase FtsW [bacterium]|nr:cell division protein FtsW [Patescibacteria group bacterium]HNU76147.1 putative peptidoglycan glycosyltransferase FtsW [bacterium]HRY56899.1 putative peptidoglycan glycosyltransferase FtsW [Patescibacteria group bacterium]
MKKRNSRKTDISGRKFFIAVTSFLLFGLLMIADSTSVSSKNLYGDPYRFVILQATWAVAGLIAFYFFYRIDYRSLVKISRSLFLFNLLALIVLAIVGLMPCSTSIPFSPCVNGANRWLYLNPAPLPAIPFLGVLGFQPGELAKLSVIVYLASQLSLISQKDKSAKNKKPFEVYLKITVLMAGLIILQPNMSTAAMVFILGTIIYFVSGAPLKPIFITIPIFLLLAILVILSSPYRMARLKAMISGEDSSESSYHVKQALVALGSGGFSGVGFGQSKQKYQYLPEVASDSIFAIIGEEFGFIGTVVVVLAYGLFIFKGFRIAKKSQDMFGKLVSIGISSWLGIQFFINVASMTKLIPMTGVPIPLISYGGSSLVFSLIGLGILANVQKNSSLD